MGYLPPRKGDVKKPVIYNRSDVLTGLSDLLKYYQDKPENDNNKSVKQAIQEILIINNYKEILP